MLDWRLDRKWDEESKKLNAVVCGMYMPSIKANTFFSGGGLGNVTHIPLQRVCDRHVIVCNGKVIDSGFRVDRTGLSLTLSRAVPDVGQCVVLGFGRVLAEREHSAFEPLSDVASHFPTPRGFSFGYHPYNDMYASNVDNYHKYRRTNSSYQYIASGNGGPYGGDTPIYGRINDYELIMPYCVSKSAKHPTDVNNAGYKKFTRGIMKLDVRDCSKTTLSEFHDSGYYPQFYMHKWMAWNSNSLHTNSYAYHPVMFPDRAGNLYLMPITGNAHVWVLRAPDYVDFEDLGPGTAPGGSDSYSGRDLFLNAAREFSTAFRLFDGRILGLPEPGLATRKKFYIFNPETQEMNCFEPAGLEQLGTSRWKMPTQARNGKVYALPTTFPGNTTLIFDPSDDSFTQHTMGIAYPRADILHTDGVATGDGRIIYNQFYSGAATDINDFLILNTNDNTSTITGFGLVKSTLYTFVRALALPDGNALFLTSPGQRIAPRGTTNKAVADYRYSGFLYNWKTDDYRLYKLPWIGGGDFLYADTNGPTAPAAYVAPNDKAMTRSLLLPNWSIFSMVPRVALHGGCYTNYAWLDTFEIPSTAYPGTYVRQAFFGRGM